VKVGVLVSLAFFSLFNLNQRCCAIMIPLSQLEGPSPSANELCINEGLTVAFSMSFYVWKSDYL
jgi:hypothetical protein